jgi:hypothetical protein
LGGYLPHPVAVALVKVSTYTALGFVVSLRSEAPMNPFGFGFVRVVAGWIVGAPLMLAVGALVSWAGWGESWLRIGLC